MDLVEFCSIDGTFLEMRSTKATAPFENSTSIKETQVLCIPCYFWKWAFTILNYCVLPIVIATPTKPKRKTPPKYQEALCVPVAYHDAGILPYFEANSSIFVVLTGLEPVTSPMWTARSNQLNYKTEILQNSSVYCVIVKSHRPMCPIRPFRAFLFGFLHFSGV